MNKMIIAVVLLLGSAVTQAADNDLASLKKTCAACHGENGQGIQAVGAPPLAGQNKQYLTRQLLSFKAGQRGYAEQDKAGQTMRAISESLNDQQISALATHYANLTVDKTSPSDSTVAHAGAARYQNTCAVCHGQFAQGYTNLQAPNLRILPGWYIAAQLDSYANGWRGANAHADIQGRWMQSIATHISGEQREEVINFIETLETKHP